MNTIEREVLELIGEDTTTPDVFADTDTGMAHIRDSVNDSIMELCMVTGAYVMPYFLALQEEEIFYTLELERDYVGYVIEAWDRSRRYRLQQIDPIVLGSYDSEWLQSNGDATHYFHVGIDKIGIYRKPSSSGVVLELSCVCIPKPYTSDTAIVKLRDNYRRACVNYAVSEFYASRGDAGRAKEWFDRYLETAQLMRLKPMTSESRFQFGGKN